MTKTFTSQSRGNDNKIPVIDIVLLGLFIGSLVAMLIVCGWMAFTTPNLN